MTDGSHEPLQRGVSEEKRTAADRSQSESVPRVAPIPAPGGRADPPDSPWRTLAAREVYRNPWIAVTEYQVRRPDGSHGIYGVVDPGDNVSVVALDGDGTIALVGAFLYPLQRHEWAIPSGRVEPDEPPEQAARRELSEEAGIEAQRWQLLGTFALSPGISTQISYIYLARDLTHHPPHPEATEQFTIRRLPLSEAFAACLQGGCTNAVTALGILHAWHAVNDPTSDMP